MRKPALMVTLACLLLGSSVPPASAEDAPSGVVYVSPSGQSAGPGTEQAPVANLADVRRVLAERRNPAQVTVLFEGGTYHLPQQTWNHIPAESIDFKAKPDTGRPVFDGLYEGQYWLKVGPTSSKLTFQGFTVRRYTVGGIMLRGTGPAVSQRIVGATVRKIIFKELGTSTTGYAAVHLNYTSNTLIEGNQYLSLVNGQCPGCMHGVYFALESNGNRIVGPSPFTSISGDPVRAADFSSDNTVSGSTFDRTGTHAVFSAWRLTRDPRCSSGNIFYTDTEQWTGYNGQPLPAAKDGADATTGPCTPVAVRTELP